MELLTFILYDINCKLEIKIKLIESTYFNYFFVIHLIILFEFF